MTPKDLLDNFDKLVKHLAIGHITDIQSGKLGSPTTDDLSRCGRLHALLESGGMLTEESLQNPVKPKEQPENYFSMRRDDVVAAIRCRDEEIRLLNEELKDSRAQYTKLFNELHKYRQTLDTVKGAVAWFN